jgi:NAD-dependent SIR2 family protein deacetylase
VITQCVRCGWDWEANANRKTHELCESCRARKSQKINTCIVWHGHFADDMVTPIHDDGLTVLPGVRTCGKSDCCNPAHIER